GRGVLAEPSRRDSPRRSLPATFRVACHIPLQFYFIGCSPAWRGQPDRGSAAASLAEHGQTDRATLGATLGASVRASCYPGRAIGGVGRPRPTSNQTLARDFLRLFVPFRGYDTF